MTYLGIDPGKTGALTVLSETGNIVNISPFDGMTEKDLYREIKHWGGMDSRAMLERVHAMPFMGVASMFTFGQQYGMLIALLFATKTPFEYVNPAVWQKSLKCLSKGDKNVTKSAAERLYPMQKFTHQTADATLIATYGYRFWKSVR